MKRFENFMREAIRLGEQARFHAPPNPWVGCVIVKNDQIIGRGCTQSPGKCHAEIMALDQAGKNAKGSSLFVTLEPCMHVGRTPPCTQAIIRAGIKVVYIGIEDPDCRINGKGIIELQNAGIEVQIGIAQKEVRDSLKPYLYQRQNGLPYTILKTAISLDGKSASADGSSQWLTCSEARQDVHIQRAQSQAIVIGANTALRDRPQLTVRHSDYPTIKQPLRVLLDAKGKVPASGPLFDQGLAPTLVVTTSQASSQRIREWEKKGAEVQFVSSSLKGVDLQETWELMGKKSMIQVLVEGGAVLHNSLLETTLYHELMIYLGPCLVGMEGQPFFLKKISTLKEAISLKLREVKKLGESVRLVYCAPL